MSIKMIVASAALAVAFTSGSAFAAEQFNTLDGVAAEPLTSSQMDDVVGSFIFIFIRTPHGTHGNDIHRHKSAPQANNRNPGLDINGTIKFVTNSVGLKILISECVISCSFP